MSFNNQKFALCYQLPSTHRWLCETNYDSIESADKRAFALTPNQTILFPYSSQYFFENHHEIDTLCSFVCFNFDFCVRER